MAEPLLVWTVTIRSESNPQHLTARLRRLAETVLGDSACVELMTTHNRNGKPEGT